MTVFKFSKLLSNMSNGFDLFEYDPLEYIGVGLSFSSVRGLRRVKNAKLDEYEKKLMSGILSKEEAKRLVFEYIKLLGRVPEVLYEDEWVEEDLGEMGILKVGLKCPHGFIWEALVLYLEDDGKWVLDEYELFSKKCPECSSIFSEDE